MGVMMPITATVFNVLIASPSDVPQEREAIAQSLHEWNALNSEETRKVLLPVMWESHSAPLMGDRPQGIINNQVVDHCDMLIGAFWTRLGSPTGKENSGTVEEIKWFLKKNRPVMLYYSKSYVDLDSIDTRQLEDLKEFKRSIRDKGIQETYASIDELKQKLSRQLTIVMRGMSVGTVVNASVVKEARESSREQDLGEQENLRKSDVPVEKDYTHIESKIPNKDLIWLEDYTDASFVIRGNTYAKREQIKEIGGKWMMTRTGDKTWNFSKKKLEAVANVLGIPPTLKKP